MTRPAKLNYQSNESGNRDVLVVDDQAANRLVLRRTLTGLNYRVETAADGEQAWRKLLQNSFAFVVTDYEMPILDGLGLLRRIRNCPWKGIRRSPVILHSALDDERLHRTVRVDDRTYLFPKPLDVRRLTRLLQRISARSQASSSTRKNWLLRMALPLNTDRKLIVDN